MIEMGLNDIVKIVPAEKDTSKEADKFLATIVAIIILSIITTIMIMGLK